MSFSVKCCLRNKNGIISFLTFTTNIIINEVWCIRLKSHLWNIELTIINLVLEGNIVDVRLKCTFIDFIDIVVSVLNG